MLANDASPARCPVWKWHCRAQRRSTVSSDRTSKPPSPPLLDTQRSLFRISFSRASLPQNLCSSVILACRASSREEGCLSVKAASPRTSYSFLQRSRMANSVKQTRKQTFSVPMRRLSNHSGNCRV